MRANSKVRSTRHITDKTKSFCFPKGIESILAISSENSSEERSTRHLVFQRGSFRGKHPGAPRLGGGDRGRNKRFLGKPNSFTQVENLNLQHNIPNSSKNSSVDSETNSHEESTVLVPKLSKSDLASFLNEVNDCTIIEEDNKNERSVENTVDDEKKPDKSGMWHERLYKNEFVFKHKHSPSKFALKVTEPPTDPNPKMNSPNNKFQK